MRGKLICIMLKVGFRLLLKQVSASVLAFVAEAPLLRPVAE